MMTSPVAWNLGANPKYMGLEKGCCKMKNDLARMAIHAGYNAAMDSMQRVVPEFWINAKLEKYWYIGFDQYMREQKGK